LDLIRDQLDETFLVLNGDLITDMDLRAFSQFHRKHGDLLTVGVTNKNVKVDLGVIETEGERVTAFHEKPSFNYQVSMGIYCMEPGILEMIPKGVPFGFDDLMYSMLDNQLPVHIYRHEGSWMDIGRPEDFQRAQEMSQESNISMLGV
jgi:mannose-1-phosphate guanylyltransferase